MQKGKLVSMRNATVLSVVAILLFCSLLAGCTSPTASQMPPEATTTIPAVTPTLTTSVATVVATPDAVETLPAEQYVDLVLSKQRPDSSIHLLYNGGKGEIFVQNIMMKVTLSDGTVSEQYMNDGNRKPRRGDELIMEGSRGTDQVQVFVTTAGRTYKVIEESLVNPHYP